MQFLRGRFLKRSLLGLAGLLILIVSIAGAYAFWYTHRPLPSMIENQPLFEGITYSRRVFPEIPLVYHLVSIDLDAEGIGFMVTPRDNLADYDYRARTTSQFAEEFSVQLALNADFFDPQHDNHPFDYYPHVGDGVNGRGLSINNAEIVTEGFAPEDEVALYINNENRLSFGVPEGEILAALSGYRLIVENGISVVEGSGAFYEDAHPRTAIGINSTGDRLIIVVVDGRQPSYSEGLSLFDLAQLLLDEGVDTALNLDGGGSSTLVFLNENGNAELLNVPIHTRIPYRERPIANHLGIFANRLD